MSYYVRLFPIRGSVGRVRNKMQILQYIEQRKTVDRYKHRCSGFRSGDDNTGGIKQVKYGEIWKNINQYDN